MAKISMDWWWVCRGLYMGLPWVAWWVYHGLYVGMRWVQVFAMLYVFLPWVLIGFGGEWLFWVWVGLVAVLIGFGGGCFGFGL